MVQLLQSTGCKRTATGCASQEHWHNRIACGGSAGITKHADMRGLSDEPSLITSFRPGELPRQNAKTARKTLSLLGFSVFSCGLHRWLLHQPRQVQIGVDPCHPWSLTFRLNSKVESSPNAHANCGTRLDCSSGRAMVCSRRTSAPPCFSEWLEASRILTISHPS